MSVENARAFLQKAEDDDELKTRIEDAGGDGAVLVELGAAYGFSFTAEDLYEAMDDLYSDLDDA